MILYNIEMPGFKYLILILIALSWGSGLHAQKPGSALINSDQDTISDNQRLYNGKIWRNQYYLVKDDQFLYSKEFLPGSISMRGKFFPGITLKYDLYKDEILTPTQDGVLQLNKEMIDSFSLEYNQRKFDFIKLQEDTVKKSVTFFNVVYKGKTALLIRYSKKIDKLAVEGKYDQFYQISRVFLLKGNRLLQVTGKNDLLTFMAEDKTQIKEFMKANKIKVSEKDPESFIPVVKYYDSLNH
jgi:hypothetical protein